MVSQSLKKGMFGFDSRYTFSHAASDDFVDVVLGHNQAPPGCWEPGTAAKGLIPNLQDVRLRLNRAYSSKYCDMCALPPNPENPAPCSQQSSMCP